jgi:hypothetical protein
VTTSRLGGLARRSIDVAIDIASDKLLMPEMLLLRDTSRAAVPDLENRVAVALSRAHSFRGAREVAELMADLIGASTMPLL